MSKKLSKRVTIGYKEDGTRIRKRVYGSSQTELKYNVRKLEQELESISNPIEITFGAYAERWLRIYKASSSEATKSMYRTNLNRCKSIYNFPIRKLMVSDYQELVNDYIDTPNTANKVAMTIMQVVKSAASDGIIAPVTWSLKKPTYKAKEKTIIENIDIENSNLTEKEYLFSLVMSTFGLRPSECLALTDEDFDFETRELSITKAIGFRDNSPYIKEPKNGKFRTLPIPSNFSPTLPSGLLFPNTKGELMSKTSARIFKRNICNKLGIENAYAFRHTVGTKLYYLCCANKLTPKMASKLMGHSEVIFLSTYSHIDSSRENISEIFS